MNRLHKDIITNYRQVRIHITGYTEKSTGYTLRGYAIDEHGVRIDGSKTLRRTARTASGIPAAERHLVAAVLNVISIKAAAESRTGPKIDKLDPKHPMVRAYRNMIEEGIKISATWNEEVEKRNISGFGHRVLPRILRFLTEPFLDADRDALLDAIAQNVRTHGNSKQNETTVLKTARSDLAAYATVYSEGLRRIDPMLPALLLTPPHNKIKYTAEQVKSLPKTVRRKFASLLKEHIPENPKLVLGAIMMDDAALRTAEAAAIIPAQDIEEIGAQMIVKVCWQEKRGRRCSILKSDAAYRKVPLSTWGQQMVKLCCKYVDIWPDHSDAAPITADELRRFIKHILQECGLGEAFWSSAKAAEAKGPDRDNSGNPIFDLEAYILRRNRASIWRNICALNSSECDYFLGHRDNIAKKRKVDYRLAAELQQIAAKLENYVADPEMSAHPAIVSLPIKHGDNLEILPYEKTNFSNASDTPLIIDLDLFAEVAGEEIKIELENGEIVSLMPRHRTTNGTRENKPLIGTDQLTEFLEGKQNEEN